MNLNQINCEDQELFIVYKYNIHNSNKTKYVMGIYNTYEKAFERQNSLGTTYNKIMNTCTSNNGDVIFINKLKYGDSNIEMFTT